MSTYDQSTPTTNMSTTYGASKVYFRSIFAEGTCQSCQAPPMPIVYSTPSSKRPSFPCTCRNPDDEMFGIAFENAIAFRHRPTPIFLPKTPRKTRVYKRCLAEKKSVPWNYEEAVLQEDERRLTRLCLQKQGYEHGDDAIDRLSMLEFNGPGPECSIEDGLRSAVRRAPTVLARVDPNSASRLLEGFTRTDIQMLDQHIRRRASANTLRSYELRFPAVPAQARLKMMKRRGERSRRLTLTRPYFAQQSRPSVVPLHKRDGRMRPGQAISLWVRHNSL
jgi:hypothetical protein